MSEQVELGNASMEALVGQAGQASGRGTVYSYTITRRSPLPVKGLPAYVVALVELEEGVRVMANLIGAPEIVAATVQTIDPQPTRSSSTMPCIREPEALCLSRTRCPPPMTASPWLRV